MNNKNNLLSKYLCNYLSDSKCLFFVLISLLFCHFDIKSQNKVETYLNTIGDYAVIYNGKVEFIYAPGRYDELPYYNNPSFVTGEIVYKNKIYPNQRLRLDLYKEHLIVLSPEKNYGIILESKDVQKVTLYGKDFIWYEPVQSKDLKAGFYMQLYKGEKMTLLCKTSKSLQKGLRISSFNTKVKFYLLNNGNFYEVKNKKSFIKLFPKQKNQINQFVKEQKLNFGSDSERGLTLLAQYCENLF